MTSRNIKTKFRDEDASSSDESVCVFPQTYIVIKFAPKVKEKTLAWFISKVRGERQNGGAELLVRRQPYKDKEGLILHISASKIKFLQIAEEIEIVKKDRSGILREFVVSRMEDFLEEGMHVDDFLTTAERQTIVRHELENIRTLEGEHYIPSYNTAGLYTGKSILQSFIQEGLIEKIYPLHDLDALRKLGSTWFLTLFTKQPFEDIREYFGESIALYFIFLEFYTVAMIVPMVLGFIQFFVSHETLTFFCIFNVLWVIVFLEVWRRKSNALAFNWGTIGMTSLDEPRVNFRGKMGIDSITGKIQPQSPRWKTNLKMYCVSLPIVFLCLCGGFVVMLWSFWAEDEMKKHFDPDSWMIMIPSIIYTALVYIVNLMYRSFCTFLTEWENHRTQSQYDRHRVIKLVLFEFVNNFMSLFYIAFILKDTDMLKQQLATMLIILQAINHFQEAILPLMMQSSFYTKENLKTLFTTEIPKLPTKMSASFDDDLATLPDVLQDVDCLTYNDPRIHQANVEGKLDEFEGTYDDYLELFIQFGYVVLFSSVYPLAAFWGVLNNILEIRADAFKLCKVYQRPMSRKVKDTGAWQRSFEILGAMSIMTNCGLLYVSPQIKSYAASINIEPPELFFYFIVLEHLLLGIRYILHQAIPDKPEWVRIALAKKNHIFKMALKKERLQKDKKTLLRRYRSVYGMSKIDM
ncbi:abnormal X segregation isoform X2 [Arctopsyche grandis]|uniref:abnormal X segregation isoform X2 n=1 Tax=Arctopsyche grandis TaxID=121162 RepID=UPI00406DA094